jgi:hypothetical protein
MRKLLTLILLLVTSMSYSQQQSKADLIKELSGILNKAAGISWKSDELTTTIQSQTASETQITTMVYRKGYSEGSGSVDKVYTNVYLISWDSLKKSATTPPTSKKFSLSGCSESGNYCSFQLSFKPYSLKSIEYGTQSDYSSYNTWFDVYVKKEDQEKFFACLQKLYKLLHPKE